MKKMSKIYLMLAIISMMFIMTGCAMGGGSTTIDLSVCTLEDAVFTYDGTAKSLEVENLPKGAKVEYKGNEQINSGVYEVTATVTATRVDPVTLTAELTIEKVQGTISAESVQKFVLGDTAVSAAINKNNTEQKLSSNIPNSFKRFGTYELTVYAKESTNYKESDSITITVHVMENNYGLSLTSATYIADGTPKSLAVSGNLPAGATVEYTGNEQTVQGIYEVQADVYSAAHVKLCSLQAIMTIDNPQNAEFEEFMDDFLVMIFEGDQMSVNFFFNDASAYGIEHYEATLPHATFEDFDAGQIEMQALIDELRGFNDDALSYEEQDCLEIVDDYLTYLYSITEEMSYMTNGYLGSYLGYQSNLPLNLAEYKFRNEQDIIDFLAYLADAPAAFKSYYDFSVKQSEMGYGLPDYVINNVVDQCEEFIALADDESHYLVDIFNEKIDAVTFVLTEEKITDYKEQANTLVRGAFTEGYQYIYDNLPNLMGTATNQGGLANYENGQEYYMLELENVVGYYDLNGDDVVAYIDAKFNEAYDAWVAVYERSAHLATAEQRIFSNIVDKDKVEFADLTFEELVAYFQEYAKSIVPTISEMPEITIKYVPESLEDFFSPAAYFVSPIDETMYESIYLNPKYTDDYNYVYTTLAHEGYPGHLYQNVYAKSTNINDVRKVVRCDAYMEGWATYVEMKAYASVEEFVSTGEKLALQYLEKYDIVNGLLSARFDLGVHYEGWSINQALSWWKENVNSSATVDDVLDVYNQFAEIPTNSMQYYYGFCKLDDMHSKAVAELGTMFDEVEFNKVILDMGAAPLAMIEEAVDTYIEQVKFIYNIN